MSSKSNFKKIRGTFLLGSTVAGIVGTAAASASAQVPGLQETKDFFNGAYEGAKSWGSEKLSDTKNFFKSAYEGAKSWGSEKLSGTKNFFKSAYEGATSFASSAKEYISENFNKIKNTSFGKAVSESRVANFVKAHPYVTSMALIGASVFVLYKFFNRRTGKEVKEDYIGELGNNKNSAVSNNSEKNNTKV